METRAEQIKRLQGNLTEYKYLGTLDKQFLRDMPTRYRFFLHPSGRWDGCDMGPLEGLVYRIHKDYTPEPKKPVFDGYELCEVKVQDETKLRYVEYWGKIVFLRDVLDFGCCGYVFKENRAQMFNSPLMFLCGDDGVLCYQLHDNSKPATLGWVAFRSEQK